MIFKSWSVVIAAALLLSGCSFSKKSPEEVKANAFDEVSKKMKDSTLDTRDAAMSLSDFEVYFEDGAQPNQYSLVVKAARKVPKMVVEVSNRQTVEVKDTDTAKIPVSYTAMTINISVKVLTKDNLAATNLNFGSFDVPRDLVITDTFLIGKKDDFKSVVGDEVRNYSKIIFEKGSRIVTFGLDLKIETDTIIFRGDNSIRLLSSREDELNPKLYNLLIDGSSIDIKAKKVIGSADIVMMGISGSRGRSTLDLAQATDPKPFKPAPNGVKGQDAKLMFMSNPLAMQSLDGGPNDSVTVCEQGPSNGTDGQDGVILHAEDGTAGGDTGDLSLDIEDYSKAKFRIFFIPGVGGPGGIANFEGQKGGIGGAAGRNAAECKIKSVAGKNGRDSTVADSRPGRDGAPGRLGQLNVPQDSKHFDIIYELK